MIPNSMPSVMTSVKNFDNWKRSLATAITDPKELLNLLNLDNQVELLLAAKRAAQLFPLKVPLSYVQRMEKGNPRDPLLLQVLPLSEECRPAPSSYSLDPVGDQDAIATPGLLHKYHGRVLLMTTAACAVHCRYCFRRNFPYEEAQPHDQWQASLSYIENNPDIKEVILSGGDPLVLSDRRLIELQQKIEAIPHVQRLRIHTRLPVVLPERITPALLNGIKSSRLHIAIVIHSNHANELNQEVAEALMQLRHAGASLLNQAVILKGINDSLDAQIALSERLFATGVLPYYLHVLDKAQGTAHFDLPLKEAQHLHAALQQHLPGYLVPRLVREDAGQPAKTWIPHELPLDSPAKMTKVSSTLNSIPIIPETVVNEA